MAFRASMCVGRGGAAVLPPSAPTIAVTGGGPLVKGSTITITRGATGGAPSAYLLYRGGVLVGTVANLDAFDTPDCGPAITVVATNAAGTSAKSNALITDITLIPGVTCYLKSDVVTTSAGVVTAQADQSGHGNDFTRTTGATGPPYPSTINGVLAPRYNDGSHEMSTTKTVADFFSAANGWICCVIWPSTVTAAAAATGASIIGSTDGAFNLTLWDSAGTKKVSMTSTDGVDAGAATQTIVVDTASASGCHLVTARKTGTTLGISVDQAAETTSTTTVPATVPTSATLNLGYVSGAHTYGGVLGDIVTASAEPSANDKATIEAWLAYRFNTSSRAACTSFTVLHAGDSLVLGQQSFLGGERTTYLATLRGLGWNVRSDGPLTSFGLHRGIGGEEAQTVATTGLAAIVALYAGALPTVGILAWGVNDCVASNRTSTQLFADMLTILNALKAASPATRWIVQSIVRPTSGATAPQLAEIDAYNSGLSAWCVSNGATYENRGTPSLSDGVHPDQATTGYPQIGGVTAPLIATLLAAA